ncbi:MAG: TIM barrel protein [Candidatus Sumerlaeota bacterium]|nr:TIM barrel protein [Candidatus Sumerlaeota bacterium]
MIRSGLVSITFRKFSPSMIVFWACRAKLEGIEWGGDVHVPHGDIVAAREVTALTRNAGLAVAAYGSYYRLGEEAPDFFPRVLETAQTLGAPIIRVWAGRKGSKDADGGYRRMVSEDGRRIAELAREAGIRIVCEWHGGTLTDTADSARALFDAVNHPNFQTYWQPHQRMPYEQCLRDMDAALPRLAGLHVFQWDLQTVAKQPLSEGESVWPAYLRKAAKAANNQSGDLFALLEFVIADNPNQMLRDAATLREWIKELRDNMNA